MRLACLTSIALVALSAGAVTAEDEVDNPEFANWSKFKKGTTVTLKLTTTTGGVAFESTITTTLTEVGADKVVLETSGVSKLNGMEFKSPATTREVKKTLVLPKGVKKDEKNGQKPPGTYEEGTETLKISGMQIKTKWYKVRTQINGITTDSKMWMSEDVPGTTVKLESTTTGKVPMTVMMELVEFKKP